MAKGAIAMLVKLKCMIRVWRNHSKKPTTIIDTSTQQLPAPPTTANNADSGKVQPVYVGRSRRLYQLSPHLVDHPLFRVLIQKSGGKCSETTNEEETAREVAVDCEVVLFEHLLWMLENNYDEILQPEALDELVGFYTSI